jgi:hypothetical protein
MHRSPACESCRRDEPRYEQVDHLRGITPAVAGVVRGRSLEYANRLAHRGHRTTLDFLISDNIM